MKRDVNGRSVCQKSEEYYEHFLTEKDRKILVEYEFRDSQGDLFTGIFGNLEAARKQRRAWARQKAVTL